MSFDGSPDAAEVTRGSPNGPSPVVHVAPRELDPATLDARFDWWWAPDASTHTRVPRRPEVDVDARFGIVGCAAAYAAVTVARPPTAVRNDGGAHLLRVEVGAQRLAQVVARGARIRQLALRRLGVRLGARGDRCPGSILAAARGGVAELPLIGYLACRLRRLDAVLLGRRRHVCVFNHG